MDVFVADAEALEKLIATAEAGSFTTIYVTRKLGAALEPLEELQFFPLELVGDQIGAAEAMSEVPVMTATCIVLARTHGIRAVVDGVEDPVVIPISDFDDLGPEEIVLPTSTIATLAARGMLAELEDHQVHLPPAAMQIVEYLNEALVVVKKPPKGVAVYGA